MTAPGRTAHEPERRLGVTLVWALGGGALALVLSVALYVLTVWLGGWLGGVPRPALALPYHELAGLSLAGALTVFLAREFNVRAG